MLLMMILHREAGGEGAADILDRGRNDRAVSSKGRKS